MSPTNAQGINDQAKKSSSLLLSLTSLVHEKIEKKFRVTWTQLSEDIRKNVHYFNINF